MKVGDKVRIKTGQFAGKACYIEAFSNSGNAIVKAKGWYITREYQLSELCLLQKDGE